MELVEGTVLRASTPLQDADYDTYGNASFFGLYPEGGSAPQISEPQHPSDDWARRGFGLVLK